MVKGFLRLVVVSLDAGGVLELVLRLLLPRPWSELGLEEEGKEAGRLVGSGAAPT